MGLGIGRIQPVDIRQQDVQVRIGQAGHQSGEIVIVPDLEFVDGHHIIFIDDGDHPPGNHFLESIPGIGVAVPVHHVRFGQEHLGHYLPIFAKKPFIDMHQDTLAHCSAGLFARDRRWLGIQSQTAHTGSSGPRRHQDHFFSLVLEVRHDPGQLFDFLIVDLPVGIGDGTGPHFHDHPFGLCNFSALHAINPSQQNR